MVMNVSGPPWVVSIPPVSGAGNMASADLATTVGIPGQTVRLSDGDNKGAILMWAIPAGSATYAWCWWLWPQAAY